MVRGLCVSCFANDHETKCHRCGYILSIRVDYSSIWISLAATREQLSNRLCLARRKSNILYCNITINPSYRIEIIHFFAQFIYWLIQ